MTLSASELIAKYEAAKESDLYCNSTSDNPRRPRDRWVNLLLQECNMEELGHLKQYLTEKIANANRKHQQNALSEDHSKLD